MMAIKTATRAVFFALCSFETAAGQSAATPPHEPQPPPIDDRNETVPVPTAEELATPPNGELEAWVKEKEKAASPAADDNPPITEADLATPPAGEIQKIFLREINDIRAGMATALAEVPSGTEGQGSQWFAKFQAWKAAVDQLAVSRLQSDALERIPVMAEVFAAAHSKSLPRGFGEATYQMKELGRVINHAIARYIVDQNGTIDAQHREKFLTFFSVRGFTKETDWEEGTLRPVDGAGIMILAPAEVVAWFKNQPWKRASRFLGNCDANEAFKRYAPGGDSIPVLQTKYAANRKKIVAKWNELAAWVKEKEDAEQP